MTRREKSIRTGITAALFLLGMLVRARSDICREINGGDNNAEDKA